MTTATGFTSVQGKTVRTEGPRRERQIYNRVKYRLTKRRNLWLRSIGAAKDAGKIKTLEAKIEAIDFALKTLDEA